ncbi:hypothetical protein TNCV_956201 [Trichonephila clavipes]|nr:hypothetical protein TNCV_956201 [Trichonephila clavipes]
MFFTSNLSTPVGIEPITFGRHVISEPPSLLQDYVVFMELATEVKYEKRKMACPSGPDSITPISLVTRVRAISSEPTRLEPNHNSPWLNSQAASPLGHAHDL